MSKLTEELAVEMGIWEEWKEAEEERRLLEEADAREDYERLCDDALEHGDNL